MKIKKLTLNKKGEIMRKMIYILCICSFLYGCMFYTNGYENLVDLSSSDFSEAQNLKKGSKCSLLILGVIPWPFGNSGPDNEMEAIKEAGIKKVQITDYSYDYFFFYANFCHNIYGY